MRIGQGAAAGGAIGALTGSDDEVYDLLTLELPGTGFARSNRSSCSTTALTVTRGR